MFGKACNMAGFSVSDTMVCTGCCATLDHIVTYLFKQLTQKGNQYLYLKYQYVKLFNLEKIVL